jgi:hypothetical protein
MDHHVLQALTIATGWRKSLSSTILSNKAFAAEGF